VTKRVLPVLHLLNAKQVREQARLVYECGADGLFLIDMGGSRVRTSDAVDVVRHDWPDRWLGVNVLGYNVPDALRHVHEWPIQGLWVDHSGIDERPLSWKVMPDIRSAQFWSTSLGNTHEVFGGVAFKYGRTLSLDACAEAARVAAGVLPVVCTSGDGTGLPADLEKLEAMRSAIQGRARLAVASGVSPANAKATYDYVDDALMATGIEREFGVIDPKLLSKVIAAR